MKTITRLVILMNIVLLSGCNSDDEEMIFEPYVELTVLGTVKLESNVYHLHEGSLLAPEEGSKIWVIELATKNWKSRDEGVKVVFTFNSPSPDEFEMGNYKVKEGAVDTGTVEIDQMFTTNTYYVSNGSVTISKEGGIYTITWEGTGNFWGNTTPTNLNGEFKGPLNVLP